MVFTAEVRVRRPLEHEDLIGRLTTKEGGPFAAYWQVLVFAAALGWSRNRREAFEKVGGEPIRYALFLNSGPVTALIDSLGVLAHPNDAGIMADERLPDRVKVFEEYANGGLAVIQGEVNATKNARPTDVILNLSRKGMTQGESMMRDLFGPKLTGFKEPEF